MVFDSLHKLGVFSVAKKYLNSQFLEMSSGVSHFVSNFEPWFHGAIDFLTLT